MKERIGEGKHLGNKDIGTKGAGPSMPIREGTTGFSDCDHDQTLHLDQSESLGGERTNGQISMSRKILTCEADNFIHMLCAVCLPFPEPLNSPRT